MKKCKPERHNTQMEPVVTFADVGSIPSVEVVCAFCREPLRDYTAVAFTAPGSTSVGIYFLSEVR